jgi:hypothetical protein
MQLIAGELLFGRLNLKAARILRQSLGFAQLLRGTRGEVGQQPVGATALNAGPS